MARVKDLETEGRPAEAADQAREAQAYWRGPALAGLTGRAVEAAASRPDEQRLAAFEHRFDLELRLGRHADLVGELAETVAEHPQRERLIGQLMLALPGRGDQPKSAHWPGRRARRGTHHAGPAQPCRGARAARPPPGHRAARGLARGRRSTDRPLRPTPPRPVHCGRAGRCTADAPAQHVRRRVGYRPPLDALDAGDSTTRLRAVFSWSGARTLVSRV
jgi:Bacterial transcriptional activator domain